MSNYKEIYAQQMNNVQAKLREEKLNTYPLFSQKILNKNENIAQILYEKFNIMDATEKKYIFEKLLSDEFINHHLLKYELENLLPTKTTNKQDFIKQCEYYLKKYTFKAGGFLLDDVLWTYYSDTTKKYKLSENDLLFENSIYINYKNDSETLNFVNNLAQLFSKIDDNVLSSTIKYFDNEQDGISWIVIRVKYNQK